MASNSLVFNIIARDRTGPALAKAATNVTKATLSAAKSTGMLTAKVSAAAVAATTLVGAVAPAAGAVLLLPAAGFAAAAAFGALKIATSGLSDAMSASDPQAYAEELKKLSPAGREVVKTLKAMEPAWRAVRNAVQQATFKGVAGDLKTLAGQQLPVLRRRLSEVGAGWNAGIRASLKLAATKGFVKDTDTALGNAAKATRIFAGSMAPAISGLRHIGVVGSKFLPALAKGIEGGAKSFERWAAGARKSGELESRIKAAITVVRQLGTIAGNVRTTIAAVFKAGDSAGRGKGLLAWLTEASTKMAAFAQSAQGQQAIATFFSTVDRVVRAAAAAWREFTAQGMPVFSTLSLIWKVAQPLLSNLEQWAPTIGKIAAVVLPVIVTFKTLATVVGGLVGVIGGVTRAVTLMGAGMAATPWGLVIAGAAALGLALGYLVANAGKVKTAIGEMTAKVIGYDLPARKGAEGSRLFAEAARLVNSRAVQTIGALINMDAAMRRVTETTNRSTSAAIGWEASLDEVSASALANGRSLNIQNAAGRANVTALTNAAQAAWAKRDADIAANMTVEEANRHYQNSINKLRQVGQQAGYAKGELESIVGQYDITVLLKIKQTGVSLSALPGGIGAIAGAALQGMSQLPGRARGGPVRKGMPYLVGEEGPEVVVPGSNGTVLNNRQTTAAASRGTAMGSTLTLNLQGGGSGLERMFLSWLLGAIRRAGGNVSAVGL